MKHWRAHLTRLLFLLLPALVAQADNLAFKVESGPVKTALLELYTSQGCSSCPPADAFVSRLGQSDRYPRQVVPLSFHVTYWDYLGWRDPYARSQFDRRQNALAVRGTSRQVYTPQIFLDGRNVRGRGSFNSQLEEVNADEPGALIRLQGYSSKPRKITLELQVEIADNRPGQSAALYVALFENRLNNPVSAGENAGKTLQHDHVVRIFKGPFRVTDQLQHITVDLPADINLSNAGVAAFVEDKNSGDILQAVATAVVGNRY